MYFQVPQSKTGCDIMHGYRLLEHEAEEVVKCVRYNTEEDVVRILLKNSKESRELCTVIVADGSTALHALAQMSRPHILQVQYQPHCITDSVGSILCLSIPGMYRF